MNQISLHLDKFMKLMILKYELKGKKGKQLICIAE